MAIKARILVIHSQKLLVFFEFRWRERTIYEQSYELPTLSLQLMIYFLVLAVYLVCGERP